MAAVTAWGRSTVLAVIIPCDLRCSVERGDDGEFHEFCHYGIFALESSGTFDNCLTVFVNHQDKNAMYGPVVRCFCGMRKLIDDLLPMNSVMIEHGQSGFCHGYYLGLLPR